MLPLQFFGQNIHFAVGLFAALVFFAVFWLYFDAWTTKKEAKDLFKWAGALLVSLSFLAYATNIEQSVLGKSIFGSASEFLSTLLRLAGYISLIVGQITDPLQAEPDIKGLEADLNSDNNTSNVPKAPAIAASGGFGLGFALPVASLAIAGLYWRRATKGLERHLKPVGLAFLFLSIFEALSLAKLLRDTTNPHLAQIVAAFGIVWILEQVFLFAGVLVLGLWVWKYLIKRFLSQLFMTITVLTLSIFLVTTVGFTFLLMRNIQKSALDNLQTAVSTLNYAFDSKKAETRANAESLAQNPKIADAIFTKNHAALVKLTDGFLVAKKQSSLVITTSSGQVLLRAEDPARFGDSLSSDTLIRRALLGSETSSVTSKEDVLAPLIYIKTSVPIRDSSNNIIGSVTTGLIINNAFMDGIKNSTGLDSAVYSNNICTATTFVAPDGKSRLVGIKEANRSVGQQVLKNGQYFKGTLDILNRPYLAVYAPLKNADNVNIGMLFVGQPQSSELKTAGHSIELTFLLSVILLIVATLPAYFMSRYLSSQLE